MRLRKRAIGLLVGSAVLFFLGTNVQAGWLFVLAALMLGTVVAGTVLPVRATRGVVVVRRAPDEMHQGDEAFVEIVVHGGRRVTRRGLLVHDPFLEPADLWVGTVRPQERVEVATMRVARRRGVHGRETVSVRSTAPFGVAERRRLVALDGPDLLVLPAIEPLGTLPFVRPAFTTEVAMHSAPRRGQGPEYLGIREYRSGDSMRHVHWASTARTGAMMVREFEHEQTRRLAIVIDSSRDGAPREGSFSPLDRVCSAAASVATAALSQGHGARLVTGAGGSVDILTRADERELCERLALVQPTVETLPFPALIGRAIELLRGVETVVLVFPTWNGNAAERLAPTVEALVERIPTTVAVPVVLDRRAHRDTLSEERIDGLSQRLRAAGASVHLWRDGTSLDDTLGVDRIVSGR